MRKLHLLKNNDIFIVMNVSASIQEQAAAVLNLVGQPARIQILMVISSQEACVCHIEAALGIRQASISQHLMILRKAGIVTTHRVGRHIFYQVSRGEAMNLIQQAASMAGADFHALEILSVRPIAGCSCPQCNPGLGPNQACRNHNLSTITKG
jgi:ArsR family transcriptional regulator